MADATTNTPWIIVGEFTRPHALLGALFVRSFTDPQDNLISYDPWFVRTGQNDPVEIPVEEIRTTPKGLLVDLIGVETVEAAEPWVGRQILIHRDQLDDAVYWRDLIGMTVIDTEGRTRGTIKEMIPTGHNDVLVVVNDKTRELIPYLDDVIVKVDKDHRQLTINWPTPDEHIEA